MALQIYSAQNVDEAIETIRLVNNDFKLDSGVVVFFRKAFEEDNLGRAMTDDEWDYLSFAVWNAAYDIATDAISQLQASDEDDE